MEESTVWSEFTGERNSEGVGPAVVVVAGTKADRKRPRAPVVCTGDTRGRGTGGVGPLRWVVTVPGTATSWVP